MQPLVCPHQDLGRCVVSTLLPPVGVRSREEGYVVVSYLWEGEVARYNPIIATVALVEQPALRYPDHVLVTREWS